MDEEVQPNIIKAIETLNENLQETDLQIQNEIDISVSEMATETPMDHGDCLFMLPGTSAKAKKDTAVKVKRIRKINPDVVIVLRKSLHRESKSKARELIRNVAKGGIAKRDTLSKLFKTRKSRSFVPKSKSPRKRLTKTMMVIEKPILITDSSDSVASVSNTSYYHSELSSSCHCKTSSSDSSDS